MHERVLEFYKDGCGSYTSMLDINNSLLPIGTLNDCHPTPPKYVGRCKPTWTLCNAKVGTNKHDTLLPHSEYHFINNVKDEFLFFLDDIKRCISGNKKKYVLG